MKHLLLLISFIILLASESSAQDHKVLIKQTAQYIADVAVKQDYATVLSYTYQPFVKAHRGIDSLLAVIKKGFEMMKANGMVLIIKDAEIGDPGDEVKLSNVLYSVVPEKLTLNINGVVYTTTSSLIGISSDKGKQWYFVDAGSTDDLILLLPDVKQLTIPPATAPERVTN